MSETKILKIQILYLTNVKILEHALIMFNTSYESIKMARVDFYFLNGEANYLAGKLGTSTEFGPKRMSRRKRCLQLIIIFD